MKGLYSIGAIILTITQLLFAATGDQIKGINNIALEIKEKSGIIAAIPSTFPYLDNSTPRYATLLTLEKDEYEINLGYAPGCNGGNACSYGHLAGKRIVDNFIDAPHFHQNTDKAYVINLAKNIEGYFIESECCATCSDAQIFWTQDGCQYMIGIKAGSKENVMRVANSAIRNIGTDKQEE